MIFSTLSAKTIFKSFCVLYKCSQVKSALKMSEYPDPDEEFELMYDDELELIREHEKSTTQKSTSNKENSVNASNNATQTPSATQSSYTVENHGRKRTIQELFGDIDDLLNESSSKKYKEEIKTLNGDEQIIQKILEMREQNKEANQLTLSTRNRDVSQNNRDEGNISFTIPNYPHFELRNRHNVPFYVRFHSDEYMREEVKRTVEQYNKQPTLGNGFETVWEEAQALLKRDRDQEEHQFAPKTQLEVKLHACVDQAKQLWVDLYKPKRYMELLSDESTNRTLLRWIKLWDFVVFNRRPKIPSKPSEKSEKINKWNNSAVLNTELDESGRPQSKIVLLCGPPGLGKTTLAHMVAKQAGYNVVEINASDDRNKEAFKTLLENATQMRSVIDREKRPNCIVFDEIDGAPSTSIDFLVKFMQGTNVITKTKNKKALGLLKRPIICICNDSFVPALRSLRQIALIVHFPPTCSARLGERLMEISRAQNIKTDFGAMIALADKSHTDIRSCLAFLHFYKYEQRPVTLTDVMRASVGEKDVQKGLFTVWQTIFQWERSSKVDMHERVQRVQRAVSSFGDYQRVALGVFENYARIKPNGELTDVSRALEWFCFTDLLNKQMYSEQNYALMAYLPYAFVVWHLAFGGGAKASLQFPNVEFEAKSRQNRNSAIVTTVLKGVHPEIRVYNQRNSLVLDTIPLLCRILTPPLRTVSLHFYTKEEKAILNRLVSIMSDYNLNYVQERTLDGKYTYNLDPDVYELMKYKELNDGGLRQLSYSNKQLIAQEVERERMRRFEGEKSNAKNVPIGKKFVPNHLQQLKAKCVKPVVKQNVSKDFFGRPIVHSTPQKDSTSDGSARGDIYYKYKDGHNHAVRKYIQIKDLKKREMISLQKMMEGSVIARH